MSDILQFASDYQEGALPQIINRLSETNMISTSGYGTDQFCASAADLIRKACKCPKADVKFLTGGTQTNATVIDCILKNWQGVVAADTGHIASHEAGAIEAGGHKVLTVKGNDGKLEAAALDDYLSTFFADGNKDHMVNPGMVYISQPTEFGTLYSKKELTDISAVCRKFKLPLYVDGARLAYALGAEKNDVALEDLAKLTDAFYIGGTKCGTLFGEAVVLPDPELIPHFFTLIKQHGALLAKGRLMGVQFETLFKDDLYFKIGKNAVALADTLKKVLTEKGYRLYNNSPTNQVFVILENSKMAQLEKKVSFSFWEKYDDSHTVVRFATSWATTEESLKKLIELL